MLLKRCPWLIVVLQAGIILASLVTAWLLRFEFSLPYREILFTAVPVLLLLRLSAMSRFNLFHGYWRYTGVNDAQDIARAVGLGSVGFFISIRYVLGLTAFPLSIYLLEALFTFTYLIGIRVISGIMMDVQVATGERKFSRVLIVGAGAAAEALIRELNNSGHTPVGCVDDDAAKRGARIHGVIIVGTIAELPELVREYSIDEIFIAIPSVVGKRMRQIIEVCQSTGKQFKTIPGLRDLLAGRVTVAQLRHVDLEDLLGRDPVRLDLDSVRGLLRDRVVMVTGAAGSIGSELCKQILDYGPSNLICLDQAETPLFFLHGLLSRLKPLSRVVYKVADITNGENMCRILKEYGVQIIFNAAAYKHVPMMESNSGEALRNNVFGLLELLFAAEASGCQHFLQISSDKAVCPSSVMGTTKRLGELILASRPSKMRCVAVRFGNVLGSQGSVVPIFQEQIQRDKRVTVTHPDITRYFMTIPEAASLVLQAFAVGEHGNILVLDMGEPVRIVDLAKTLIGLCAGPDADVPIVFTGLRPGEKLYEELFYANEALLPTSHEKVIRTQSDLLSWKALARHLAELQAEALIGTEHSIRAKIKDIIPEYTYELEAPCRSPLHLVEKEVPAALPLTRYAIAGG